MSELMDAGSGKGFHTISGTVDSQLDRNVLSLQTGQLLLSNMLELLIACIVSYLSIWTK